VTHKNMARSTKVHPNLPYIEKRRVSITDGAAVGRSFLWTQDHCFLSKEFVQQKITLNNNSVTSNTQLHG
jgi:hypothetical protein